MSDMTTPPDVRALEAKARAATPGRWHIHGGHNDYAIYSAQEGEPGRQSCGAPRTRAAAGGPPRRHSRAEGVMSETTREPMESVHPDGVGQPGEAALRALAEGAHPDRMPAWRQRQRSGDGGWFQADHVIFVDPATGPIHKAVAAYIAAAHPQAILALLAEHRRLREALEWYASDEPYEPSSANDDPRVVYDNGSRARAALASAEGTEVGRG